MRSSLIRQGVSLLAVLILGAGAILVYRHSAATTPSPPIAGVVHQPEIRIAPETSGRLAEFRVAAGQEVHQGDVLAVLAAPELAAALEEAKANAASAAADRANVL